MGESSGGKRLMPIAALGRVAGLADPCSGRTQADRIRFVQVSALTEYPDLLDHPSTASIFPSDAIERARSLLKEIGSVGAYSHSMGVPAIRKRVAQFIESAFPL